MFSNKQQSLVDRILKASLELARMKEHNTYETFLTMNDKCQPHKLMVNKFKISSENHEGRKVWALAPKKGGVEQYVLFLHGGAYVTNMTPVHWFFIGAMIQKLGCSVIVPDYPLLPDHHAEDVFKMLIPVYKKLIDRVNASHLTVMGDSAGGGMALALCQLLHEKSIEQPANLYLLSPWLDVHMDNPAIKKIDHLDPILNLQGLIDSGRAYAGSMERSSYLVSPIYGSLQGLPQTSLFVGTHEVMLPDSKKIKIKAQKSGLDLHYHEVEGLIHDGMLYPTPEGKLCRKLIFDTLRRKWSL